MMSADVNQQDRPQKLQEARDLQLRLYREIGISAVAAALDVSAEAREPWPEPSLGDIPAIRRADELAA